MTRIRTSDTVRTHLQRCRTLGEGLLKLCAHQSPYTGRTHRLFPPPQAASVRPSFGPTATPPSRATSRGCYRYANPPPTYYRLDTIAITCVLITCAPLDGVVHVHALAWSTGKPSLVPRPICGRRKNGLVSLFAQARNIPFIQRIFSSIIT